LEPGDGAAGDDQGVTGGDGEFVLNHGKEVIKGEQAGGLDFTEGRELQRRDEFRNCGFHASCLS
jgi:hypothetical protein